MKTSIYRAELVELKIQAAILLKQCRSNDPASLKQAASRFRQLPAFAECALAEIFAKPVQLKQALAVIAVENGFDSWRALKAQREALAADPFAQAMGGGFLHHWFAHYAEARVYHQQEGGFLLPYRNHIFIAQSAYIMHLGLDPDDPAWQAMGYDWVRPASQAAWQQLQARWQMQQQRSVVAQEVQ